MTEFLTSRNFAAGIEDFENLIRRKLYVDKTSFLEDLIHCAEVLQMLRPRGFGKTLSMSMLASFLEMNYQHPEDRSRPERLFKDLAVFKNKAFCDEYLGRFPVIMISLKSVKGKDFPEAMHAMMRVLGSLFKKFAFLADSDKQCDGLRISLKETIEICYSDSFDLKDRDSMISAVSIAKTSLLYLSEMLRTEYNRRAFIIVDGYDDPLEAAAKNGYYPEMLDVIAGMLETALKTNDHLETGFVTGILHISFQSIHSGFNNYDEYTAEDRSFARFMGFTEKETADLLKSLGLENRLQDVIDWYGGYNFAGNEMLCPGSVMKFLSRASDPTHNPAAFQPQCFRANSRDNDIIEISIRQSPENGLERLQHLLEGKTEEIALREFTFYPDITSDTDFDTIATLMLNTGYLAAAKDAMPSDKYRSVVRIPNKEILERFSWKAEMIFSAGNPEWLEKAIALRNALLSEDADQAHSIMTAMLRRFVSLHDMENKAFYQNFMTKALGITSGSPHDLAFGSAGDDGGFDLVIRDNDSRSAVIIECRISKTAKASVRKKECLEALIHIEVNSHYRELKEDYSSVRKFGIVFFKKTCAVMEKSQPDTASD